MALWGLLLGNQADLLAQAPQGPPDWLSPSEAERLRGLSPKRQPMFVACRYALRRVLAESAASAMDWHLSSRYGQAPRITRGPSLGAYLSLAHSQDVLVCAKAPQPVGVDIELHDPLRWRDLPAVLEMLCSVAEQHRLRPLAPEVQRMELLKIWCLKEAYAKCLGLGLDFSAMRQWSWQPAGGQDEHLPPSSPAAYGRLWTFSRQDGTAVVLALCARTCLPHIPLSVVGEEPWPGLAPHISEWVLEAAPARLSTV